MTAKRAIAIEIVRRLQAGGFAACWVGGCVRDALLGREPEDYDIATSALPSQIEALFEHTVPVGRQFGVILVVEAGQQLQVATFRADADYEDGRHPNQVAFGDAVADARRRDFTINGLFYDPLTQQLHDWVGGEADLQAGILRTIGDPRERFAEDRLRLLRAVRLAAQLDFTIEAETLAVLQSQAAQILAVSAERIREELHKLFRPPHAARGLELLRWSGLLASLLPEISVLADCQQSSDFHPEGTVFNHVRNMLAHLPADAAPSLPWIVLLHDVGKPVTATRETATDKYRFFGHERDGAKMAETILQRLRFPRKQIDEIVVCVRYHMQLKDAQQMRRATLRRLLMRPTFPLELELHRLDCLGSHQRLNIYEFLREQAEQLTRTPQLRPPLLRGKDLMALGLKPGPALGALLTEIREKQLQDELATAEQAREWARQRIVSNKGA